MRNSGSSLVPYNSNPYQLLTFPYTPEQRDSVIVNGARMRIANMGDKNIFGRASDTLITEAIKQAKKIVPDSSPQCGEVVASYLFVKND